MTIDEHIAAFIRANNEIEERVLRAFMCFNDTLARAKENDVDAKKLTGYSHSAMYDFRIEEVDENYVYIVDVSSGKDYCISKSWLGDSYTHEIAKSIQQRISKVKTSRENKIKGWNARAGELDKQAKALREKIEAEKN